ncbi:hypothetical protein CEXT_226981 [Caerostris extrusa]|uniref:Uncharacterized protein n=1 Tax=Caerostris extrusa TaxID=172846 RepID=A0AAV4XYF5_CAEEX|nr:hypothetical protein CEXT_226981 [Caerostris extrusa]
MSEEIGVFPVECAGGASSAAAIDKFLHLCAFALSPLKDAICLLLSIYLEEACLQHQASVLSQRLKLLAIASITQK